MGDVRAQQQAEVDEGPTSSRTASPAALAAWSSDHEYVLRVAHELRNPVAAIAALASTLERRDRLDEAQVDEVVALLGQVSDHLRELVMRLIDATSPGGESAHIAQIDVGETVREIANTVPRPDRVLFVLDAPPGLSALADPLHFRQVLINLLSNAYSYGGDHVAVTVKADPAGRIIVQVLDDGPGLPDHVVTHLAQPFVRGDRTNDVDLHGGLGLGLAICFQLSSAFAELSYERADGMTVFTLDFGVSDTARTLG